MTSAHHEARKSMRAIPLTQRQRKQAKPESKAALQREKGSRGPRGKQTKHTPPTPTTQLASTTPPESLPETTQLPRLPETTRLPRLPETTRLPRLPETTRLPRLPQRKKPSLPIELAETAPLSDFTSRPSAPLDPNAENGVPHALDSLAQPAEPLDMQDTTWLIAPPRTETSPVARTAVIEAETLHNAAPNNDAPRRMKVRVRRKRPAPPSQSAASEINTEMEETIILPQIAPQTTAPTVTSDPTPGVTLNITLSAETIQLTSPEKAAPPIEETPSAPASALDTETTLLDRALAKVAPTPNAAPEESASEKPASEEDAPEPLQTVTVRKLPTLAVMAALATRAETRADASESEEALDAPLITPLDASPMPTLDAMDVSDTMGETDAMNAASVVEAPKQPGVEEALATTPEPTPDSAMASRDESLLSDLRAILNDTPTQSVSVARPELRGGRPTSQPLAPASSDDPSAAGKRMWWRNVRQPAQETREAPATPKVWNERDARAFEPPAATPTPPIRERLDTPAPRRVPPITRQLDREPEIARLTSRAPYGRPAYGRAGASHEEPATLLIWAGGVQATLSGAAAFVAAIALLNGSAGARAMSVFTWAILFALIGVSGAGLAHLAWRARRVWLATLALVLSQIGLLFWALALLGPRAALMTLAPIPVALALRGLGRPAALIAGLSALALYLFTLALSLTDWWTPAGALTGFPSAALDATLVVAGLALSALALGSLYATGERERARTRAIERAARMATRDLHMLRAQTEDDAYALRQALSAALRGSSAGDAWAHGALSPLAEQINVVADRLVDLTHDREERKRLESATRRLTRNIERAWLGLSWEWPEASGVILDDLVALLRTPPHSQPAQLPEDSTPTGQMVAPHLNRAWQPSASIPSQPLTAQQRLWPDRSTPSQPSGVWPTLWPSDPEPAAHGVDPLALPPSPRWRGPDSAPLAQESGNGHHSNDPSEMADLDTTTLLP